MGKKHCKPLHQKNKCIGPRTKQNPKEGKMVRVDDHGFDEFFDYFTDESVSQAVAVSPKRKPRRSTVIANGNASIPSFTIHDAAATVNRKSSIFFRSNRTAANSVVPYENNVMNEDADFQQENAAPPPLEQMTIRRNSPRNSDVVNAVDHLSPILPASQLNNQITSTPFIRRKSSSSRGLTVTFKDDSRSAVTSQDNINTFQQLSSDKPETTATRVLNQGGGDGNDADQPRVVLFRDDHTSQQQSHQKAPSDRQCSSDGPHALSSAAHQSQSHQHTPGNMQHLSSSNKSTRDPLVETIPKLVRSHTVTSQPKRAANPRKKNVSSDNEENAVASPMEAPILSPNVAGMLDFSETVQPKPHSVQKKRKIVQPEEANVDANLRRSKRNKVATLAWYKGERVRYKWTPEGFEVDSIIPPVFKTPKLTARKTVRKLTKQTNKRGKNKMKLVVGNDQSDLSAHVPIDANENSFVSSSVIDVFDLKSHRIVPCECVMKYCKSALRNCQTKEPANEDDPLVMLRGLSTDVFCAGILEIRPLQEKSMQLVKSDLMIFNVSFGKLEVTVCETKLLSSSGDFFYVPPGNKYSLRNLRNETARLSFVNIKNFLNIYSVPF